ncbi:hypothetical protein BV898_13202 [Hypsibius exemplaris]|uniref:Uncharacterized protein n=1 Tax=Hypsibius exemplaris TaxID=2072580 RepID=A0A1W0WBK4_HYPEX|nr:hypothetical protein BV898_13202 [Hypsibius exemplaris]
MILLTMILLVFGCSDVQSSLPCLLSKNEQLKPIPGYSRLTDQDSGGNELVWGYVCCRRSENTWYTASIEYLRHNPYMPGLVNMPSNSCNIPTHDPVGMLVGSSTHAVLSVKYMTGIDGENSAVPSCLNPNYGPCMIQMSGSGKDFLQNAYLAPCRYNPIIGFSCNRANNNTVFTETVTVNTNQCGGFVDADDAPIWRFKKQDHMKFISEFSESGALVMAPSDGELFVFDPDTWGTERWNISISVEGGVLQLDNDQSVYPTAAPIFGELNGMLMNFAAALQNLPALRLTRSVPYSSCVTMIPPCQFRTNLTASNPTGTSATTHFYIFIFDENDRPPVFQPLSNSKVIQILESGDDWDELSSKLPIVKAIDGDTGIGCPVRYALESGGNYFAVNPVSGQISVTNVTALEIQLPLQGQSTGNQIYNITVRAFEDSSYNFTPSGMTPHTIRCSEDMFAYQSLSVELRINRKLFDGCPAERKVYANGEIFHWRPVPASEVSNSIYERPIEFCPKPDFRRLCVNSPEQGFSSIVPVEPCRTVPLKASPVVTLLGKYLVDFPQDQGERQILADSVSQELANETNALTVTDINYLALFLTHTTEGVVTPNLFCSLVNIIGQMSNTPLDQLQAAQNYSSSSNAVMTALENLAQSLDLGPDGNNTVTVNVQNLAVQVFGIPRNAQLSRKTILGFAARANSTNINNISRENVTSSLDSENAVSITLPESLMLRLFRQSLASTVGIRGHYLVFREVALLQVAPPYNTSNISTSTTLNQSILAYPRIASWIIGASFGPPIMNLPDPITFRAQVDSYNPDKNHTCVFWNTTADDGQGVWQSNGCTLTNQTGRHITCQCNHLTSFAILVDFFAAEEGAASLPPFLDALTTAALSLSIIGLLLTIGLILIIWRLTTSPFRRRSLTKNEFVVLNLSVALLLAYVTFLAGIDAVTPRAGCVAAGAFIHYFFLVTSLWGGVEGYLLYQAFATAAPATEITHFQVKASAIAWGIPVVLVSIVLLLDPEYYAGRNVCWLHNQASLYLAFIAPICLTLLANLVVFALIMRELWMARKAAIRSTRNKEDIWTDLRRGMSLFFLLGLPWLLLTLNVFYGATEGRLALHVLVIIFCGTQGFGIFAVHVYGMRRELKDLYLHHMKPNTAKRERNKKLANTSSTSSV